MSGKVAGALGRHEGELRLDGLTTLSPEAAKGLAAHHGWVYLDSLTTLSESAARALLKNKRDVYVNADAISSLTEELRQELGLDDDDFDIPF